MVAAEAEKQEDLAVRKILAYAQQLNRVAYPLLVAAAPSCEKHVGAGFGWAVANKHNVPKELADATVRVLGFGETLKVTDVAAGSPAARAGVQVGDTLLTLGASSFPTGKAALLEYFELLKNPAVAKLAVPSDTIGASAAAPTGTPSEPALVSNPLMPVSYTPPTAQVAAQPPAPAAATPELGSVPLVVERAGQRVTLSILPVKACVYPVWIVPDDAVNAFADGNNVGINTGLLRLLRSDEELSVVVAHEIAHNAMGHIRSKTANYVLGSILDVVAAAYGVNTQNAFGNAAAGAYSKDFEAEADYVGLYFMARAGFPIAQAPDVWREFGAANPGGISKALATTHPSTPERFVALEQTVAEIEGKRASGMELLPNEKR